MMRTVVITYITRYNTDMTPRKEIDCCSDNCAVQYNHLWSAVVVIRDHCSTNMHRTITMMLVMMSATAILIMMAITDRTAVNAKFNICVKSKMPIYITLTVMMVKLRQSGHHDKHNGQHILNPVTNSR